MIPISHALVAVISLAAAQIAFAQTTQPTTAPGDAERAFAIICKLVGGEWTINANWSSGEPLSARSIYTWGPGKRFVRNEIHVRNPDGTEYVRYETIYGIRDGRLIAWGFTFDGSTSELVMRLKDDKTLAIDREMSTPNGKTLLRQTVTLIDNDHLQWKVWTEQGETTTQLMNAAWIRS